MNFFHRYRPDHLPDSVTKKGVLAVQREIILQNLLNVSFTVITIGFIAVLVLSAFSGGVNKVFRSGLEGAFLLGYLLFAAVALIRRIPYLIRAAFVVIVFQLIGVRALLSFGLSGTGITFIFTSILLANLLLNQKLALVFDFLGLATLVGIGAGMILRKIPVPPVAVQANSGDGMQWFLAGLVLVFAVGVVGSSFIVILRGMNTALIQHDKLTHELELEQASLEQRVQERSADLVKRVDQFEIASQIAREISGQNNLGDLLNSAVNLIHDRFSFYHVGVFLNDDRNEYTILRAATGEAGRQMLERDHRLKIGEIGMAGYVAGRGEPRISMDVTEDIVHYKNPLLPDTRSEMALPLRAGEVTIGALDVQSVVPNAFSQEDVRILQTIADQLAIAAQKTRLMEELQRSLNELEATERTTTLKTWRTHLRNTHQNLAYRYRDSRLDTQVEETGHAQEALDRGRSVLKVIAGEDRLDHPQTVLAVPIRLRNQVLGVVDIHFDSTTVSPDLVALIEGTVNRLAISLENARLLEEIQLRAERERLVSEVSTKVRAAADVDSVLRIAIQEIGRSLGVSEVMVQLRKE